MDELDDRIFAIAKEYRRRNESLTDGALRAEPRFTDEAAIKAALQRLVQEGLLVGVPLNYYVSEYEGGTEK